MAAWFIFKHDAFFPMLEWEQKYFNDAVAAGNNTVTYDWRAQYGEEITLTGYIVDLVKMTQTNTSTGTSRPMLYLANQTSHAVTSPFR
jgi:hypothetical protein